MEYVEKDKGLCFGGISQCKHTAWTWPPVSLNAVRLHGWGHIPHHTLHPARFFSTHGSSLSVSVFYLTSLLVKYMYGTYRQKSMPLIGLKNWFTAILLSPLTHNCGLHALHAVERFFGTKPPALIYNPYGLKVLVRTASVWNPWHLF